MDRRLAEDLGLSDNQIIEIESTTKNSLESLIDLEARLAVLTEDDTEQYYTIPPLGPEALEIRAKLAQHIR